MKPKIHPEAFRSARDLTRYFSLISCDLTELSFSFLMGFNNIHQLTVINSHIPELRDFPMLPELSEIQIRNCSGINDWTEFPTLNKAIWYIILNNNGLNNQAAYRIMKWIKRGLSSAVIVHDIDIKIICSHKKYFNRSNNKTLFPHD